MKTIAVGGQMMKSQIAQIINTYEGGEFTAVVGSDFEAALKVKTQQADYYFGCCATGAGGSLAGAIAILGYSSCMSVSLPGKNPVREDIAKGLSDGKKAFGFTDGTMEEAVRLLLEEISKQ